MLKFKVDLDVLIAECANYAQYMYLFYKKYGKGPHYLDRVRKPEQYELYNNAYNSERKIWDMEDLIRIPCGISMQVYRIAERYWKRTSGNLMFPTEKVFASLMEVDKK